MNVKDTARKQYVQIVDRTAQQLKTLMEPSEGWLSTLRKVLGMSGAQVAARAGVSRNAIYQAERNEREGAITINQMRKLAEAMGGRFVYAIIPEGGKVEDVIRAQARRKAEARIKRASAHMALEKQSLTAKQNAQRIESLADELIRDMPSDFWEVK
jgi:predicted DNA-binding mobile mystery protein A